MSPQTVIWLLFIGLAAGALGGVLGIGGGMIMIPALVLLLHLDPHTAVGTSLAVMLPPIGLAATYNYYKSGAVNMPYALTIAAAFMVGSYFSSKIALMLPEVWVRRIFSIFLVAIAVRMFFSKES